MKNKFRVLLAERRETIASVHEATGISKSALTDLYYERTNNPRLQTLLKIADYLDVTVNDILGMRVEVGNRE